MGVAADNLKQMETNNSELQLELDEKNRIILDLKKKLEPLVTSISLLESKFEESEEKIIKLNSQLDESLFNGSRIEQELDLYKKEISQVAGSTNNNNGELFHLKVQVNILKSEAQIKDEKIQSLYLEKYKLEEALKLATKNDNSQVKNQDENMKALSEQLKAAQNKKKKPQKKAKVEQANNIPNVLNAIEVASSPGAQENLSAGNEINNVINSVVVKGLSLQLEPSKYKLIITSLAALMGLSISESDVLNVKMLENKRVHHNPTPIDHKLTLCAEFKDHQQKVNFLSSKAKLRARAETKHLIIYEYNDDKVLNLYHLASVLRNFGYKVYCRNNAVFSSKNGRVTKIYCSQQVHSLLHSERGHSANSTTSSTLDIFGNLSIF